MTDPFSFAVAPFDELSAIEQALVREAAVHVRVQPGETLFAPGAKPQHL